MENKRKVDAGIRTLQRLDLKYENKSDKLIVQEDSILDCHRKIDKWIEGREDSEFVVDLTGGTKIMSIAAYEYFKDYSSKMIYIPIPKNEFLVPFPKKSPSRPTKLTLRLSVVQYLTAYGLDVVNEAKLKTYQEEAQNRRELSEWIVKNYGNLKNLLVWLSGNLRDYRGDKECELAGEYSGATKSEMELMKKLRFSHNGNTISKRLNKSEIRYLTGGWQ